MTNAIVRSTLDSDQVALIKRCPDCGKSFPATREYFHKGTNKGGLATYCKACANARALAHHYANREKRLVYLAEYREQHREELRKYKRKDMQAKRSQDREYYWSNVEKLREQAREYYQNHKDAFVRRARQWAKDNPDKSKAYTRVKALRRRGAPMDSEAREYVKIILNDPCVYCGQPTTAIDHIHPISQGGTSDWINLAPACRLCNAAKTDKSLLTYLWERIAR